MVIITDKRNDCLTLSQKLPIKTYSSVKRDLINIIRKENMPVREISKET